MTDFNILKKALKVASISRIKSGNVASWKIILNVFFERYGRVQFYTNCNYDISTLLPFTCNSILSILYQHLGG